MKNITYNRISACEYAKKWALKRNPQYYNYNSLGGDCTNFISQCIFAGSKVMNYSKQNGWYYIDGNRKSPSWTGVEFLYNFLITNKSVGPFGKISNINEIQNGDIAQLSFDGNTYSHSLIILDINQRNLNQIYIASHTYDSYYKPIAEYNYSKIRFVHIENVRKW